MYRLHIFDFDGVIADSMYVWSDAAPRILRQCGVNPPAGLSRRVAHLNMEDTARLFKEEFGLAPSVEELIALTDRDIRYEYAHNVKLRPGIVTVLQTLRAAGARLCIATGSPGDMIEATAARLGIAEYFEFVQPVWAGSGKHKPDIYLRCLERLGGSDPAEAVVYEDSLVCMQTAAKAGFAVYGLPAPEDRKDAEALPLKAVLSGWSEWRPEL